MFQVFNRIGQELADKYSLAHYDYVHVMYVFVHFLAVDIYLPSITHHGRPWLEAWQFTRDLEATNIKIDYVSSKGRPYVLRPFR